MANAVALLSVLLLSSSVNCLTDPTLPDIFFPFGTDVGDKIVPVGDDISSPAINIPGGFPFFNVRRNTVYVSLSQCFCYSTLLDVNNYKSRSFTFLFASNTKIKQSVNYLIVYNTCRYTLMDSSRSAPPSVTSTLHVLCLYPARPLRS